MIDSAFWPYDDAKTFSSVEHDDARLRYIPQYELVQKYLRVFLKKERIIELHKY